MLWDVGCGDGESHRMRLLTPAHNAKAVDHGGVRVSADNTVRVEDVVVVEHSASQIFKIDLCQDRVRSMNYRDRDQP